MKLPAGPRPERAALWARSTWYRINAIYNGIKWLNELEFERLTPEGADLAFSKILGEGNIGAEVRPVQQLRAVINIPDGQIPVRIQDRIVDQNRKDALTAFQLWYALVPDGVLDRETWNKINEPPSPSCRSTACPRATSCILSHSPR